MCSKRQRHQLHVHFWCCIACYHIGTFSELQFSIQIMVCILYKSAFIMEFLRYIVVLCWKEWLVKVLQTVTSLLRPRGQLVD